MDMLEEVATAFRQLADDYIAACDDCWMWQEMNAKAPSDFSEQELAKARHQLLTVLNRQEALYQEYGDPTDWE